MTIRFLFFLLLTTATVFAQPQPAARTRAARTRHFLQAIPSPANATPYGNNPKAGHYVQAGDANIYYELYGKGKPIVILHGGIYGSTYEMAGFIDSLSRTQQVIAVTTRGHGKSSIGSVPLSYEQKANDVYAVIRAVTKDSVVVLGFSDGGFTGYKLAAMYPMAVKKLIVIGAAELHPGNRTFNFTKAEAFRLDKNYFEQQLSIMPEPQRWEDLLTKTGTFYSQLTVGKDLFERIQCPTLLMAGDRDEGVQLHQVVSTAQQIRQCAVSIIPNAGHAVFLTNFPAVWASITPFLRQ